MSRANTLIEMLAVLMILALAATLALGSSGSRGVMAQRAAESAVVEALECARVMAARSGGAEVRFEDAIAVRSVFDDTPKQEGRTSQEIQLPEGWNARLEGVDQVLVFDRLGCSTDARIVLRGPAGQFVLQLEGLSGRCRRDTSGDRSAP